VTTFLGKVSGLTIITDPKITPHLLPAVTLSVHDMRLDNVLRWVERLTQTHHEIRNGSIFLTQGAQAAQPDSDIGKPWKQAIDRKLDVPITLDFADTSLPDALQFIQNVSGLNIILLQPSSNFMPITMKVSNTPVRDALNLIMRLCDAHFEQRDQAIGISAGSAPSSAPAHAAPPPAPGSPALKTF
jgi:hypothetical protein